MPGVAIVGRGLTRDYPAGERSLTALDHVDIDIDAGSLVAITGPSGREVHAAARYWRYGHPHLRDTASGGHPA